ncbi:hypothetical protein F511_30973 [Dorcoceras hygrometricum]|uniref:Uncharacterized protein n=1 Tax=Dorcoceras hygrometricum TaxID=472368 RepID=A0A2Z7CU85_9LAMI|nr:hypothetical protein F511_30973 [Dorcoceras hygrometricum]
MGTSLDKSWKRARWSLMRDLIVPSWSAMRRRLGDISLDASWMVRMSWQTRNQFYGCGQSPKHLLFIVTYFIRFSAVEDVAWSKVGSVGFLFPRRFFLYLFRRLWWTRRVNAKELQYILGSYSGRLGLLLR